MIPISVTADIQEQMYDIGRVAKVTDMLDETRLTDEKKIKEAAEKFEAFFLQLLLKEMRSAVPKYDEYLSSGHASEMYQSLLDEELAQEMARRNGFGLQQLITQELKSTAGNPV